MAPDPLAPESIARAVAALPVSLFIGSVSLPLNAEVTTLASELDPKITDIQAQIAATLELCHPGNEPSAGRLKDDVDDLRAGGEYIYLWRIRWQSLYIVMEYQLFVQYSLSNTGSRTCSITKPVMTVKTVCPPPSRAAWS